MKIILQGYNKSIHKKNNLLTIKEKDEEIYKIPAKKVTDIVITAKGYITFDALTLISQNNIPLIATNKYGQIEYIIKSPQNENITLIKKQYKTSENQQGLKIAKEIIHSKMKNQYSTLKTLNKNKKNQEVNEIKQNMKKHINKIKQIKINKKTEIPKTKKQIMGIEGKTSTEYWKAISILINTKANFKTRDQKPKQDITNAMLNYAYAILASEITKIILSEKLDPYCGILHADLNNRTSLTYDIIEEFRQQIVDKTVLSLINKKQITEEDLDKRSNLLKNKAKYILTKNIMNKLYTQINYQNETMTYIEIIEKQVKKIKKSIEENKEYKGFNITW